MSIVFLMKIPLLFWYNSFVLIELVGLDTYVLKKAIQVLERRGKAKLFIDDGTGEEDGVKFFS